jgi:hypothetical protein
MKKNIPLHPVLISVYPILALMAFNLGEFPLSDALRSLLISFIGLLVIWFILWVILKNVEKSALISSLFLFFFFSYGHIYLLIKQFQIGDFMIGRHRYLLPIVVVLLFVGVYGILKTKREIKQITLALNWIAIILIVFPLYQIASFSVMTSQNDLLVDTAIDVTDAGEFSEQMMPDIYYIILDAYTRQDTLESLYGYDNSEFIEELNDLGFYVAGCSQSNYPETYHSLLSAMNMEYEQSEWNLSGITNTGRINSLLTNNTLRRFLVNQGYITVAFESGAWWSEFADAEIYLSYKNAPGTLVGSLSSVNIINDFEIQLLDTTLITAIEDIEILAKSGNVDKVKYQNKRSRILYTLEELKFVHNFDGPKFVFAHIISPHRPFIFGPNGEDLIPEGEVRDAQEYAKGYTDQITFINDRMLKVFKSIINNSEIPPIIIVQGDHGPSTNYGVTNEQRSTILNAYYLPDGGDELLYPSVSPVNSFRVVLNYYFDADLELLDDVHYYSIDFDNPEDYIIIPNIGPVCGEQ